MEQKDVSILRMQCLVGEGGTGAKSSLVERFVHGKMPEDYDSTLEATFTKKFSDPANSNEYMLTIFDTAGQEEYRVLQDQFILRSDSFIVGYSINTVSSLNVADYLIQHIAELRGCNHFYIPLILIGNKMDLESERKISTAQGQAIADKYSIPFIETSAKLNINVTECFEMLIAEWNAKVNLFPLRAYPALCKPCTLSDKKALKIMKELLSKGKQSGDLERELLWISVSNNFVKCVSWLLNECDFSAKDIRITTRGTTIYDHALSKKNKKIISSLSNLIEITHPLKSATSVDR